MPAVKSQVKRFEFPLDVTKTYELPAHWTAFQVVEGQTLVVIWAYRNGNS